MGYGFERQPRIAINNTATLHGYLYGVDDQLVPLANITNVRFTVVKPGGDSSLPDVNSQAGTVIGDGHGRYIVAANINTIEGEYKGIAIFTYTDDGGTLIKTVVCDYDAFDPFKRADPTPADGAVDLAWEKLEDCFDSEIGGPWLRDMTLASFERSKIKDFIPDVLLEANATMPQTEFTVDSFPWGSDDGTAIFGWGLLLATIRHLMRSYTEQPNMTNSPVPWMDRTKYQQAWSVIYQIEKERYDELLRLWKVRAFAQSRAALLVASKQGRLLPAPMRSRNVGRGYYKYPDLVNRHLHFEDLYEVE